jgi:hypothetical protein
MYSELTKKDIEEWRRIKKNRNKCSRKDKRQRKIAHHVFLREQSAISLFLLVNTFLVFAQNSCEMWQAATTCFQKSFAKILEMCQPIRIKGLKLKRK